MLFKLICQNVDGVAIPTSDLTDQQVHTGNLVLEHWQEGSVFNRPVKRARLLTTDHSLATDILSPLFDPVMVRMTNNQLIMSGTEIVLRAGATIYYSQQWLIRAV